MAAMNEHKAVVKLLLTKDGVDPDPKVTEYSQTPLSWVVSDYGYYILPDDLCSPGDSDYYNWGFSI
jgi:hypothetical protein